MRTAITIIVTAIAVSFAWFWTLRYKPNWIAKIMLDANGFPRIKKAGDRFVVGGNLFFFNGESWVQLSNVTGFPINPAPKEGDTFIIDKVGYKFTNGSWVKITGPSENEDARLSFRSVLYLSSGQPLIQEGVAKPCDPDCLVPYDGNKDGVQDVSSTGQKLYVCNRGCSQGGGTFVREYCIREGLAIDKPKSGCPPGTVAF